MNVKEKTNLIEEINKVIKKYGKTYKLFEKLDDDMFNKFYRKYPYGSYNPIKRLLRNKEKQNLKEQRKKVFETLKLLRDKIVKYEKEYKLQLGETPHCSFELIVNGGYGSKLSRSYGDLAKLNEEGYFPYITHDVDIGMIGKGKRKMLDFEETIIQKSRVTVKQYGLEGYDIKLNQIDNY